VSCASRQQLSITRKRESRIDDDAIFIHSH